MLLKACTAKYPGHILGPDCSQSALGYEKQNFGLVSNVLAVIETDRTSRVPVPNSYYHADPTPCDVTLATSQHVPACETWASNQETPSSGR